MSGIYIASKTRHAPRWKALRQGGVPIVSTWIDEAEPGESPDLPDLARRCIDEAIWAAATIVYAEPGDVLKGAWVEMGAALAHGRLVILVDPARVCTGALTHHPLVQREDLLDRAIELATQYAATAAKGE